MRELSNVLERAALLADEQLITAAILALPIGQEPPGIRKVTGARASITHQPGHEQGSVSMDDAMRAHVSEVLARTGWNLSRAAALLGIARNTLHARIRKYGLQPPTPRQVGRAAGGRQRDLAPPTSEKVLSPEPKPWDQRNVAYLFTTFRLQPPGLEPVSAGRVLPVIADKVEIFGGRIEERMPTGMLSVFGLEPVDNAPSIAALAALAIQAELLRSRDTGQALTSPMMVVHAARVDVAEGPGEPLVNFQSKATAWETLTSLLADAAPGAIVVSRAAEPFLRRRFFLTSSTAEGHQTYRLVRRYDAPLRRAQNEFIGREGQLQILREAFGRIGTGRGLVVAVVGDPGVGKSRLVHEALRDINEWGILQCRAEPYGRSTSYLPFAALLRAHCGIEDSDEPADIRSKVTQSLLGSDNRLSDAVPPLLELLHALPANDPFVSLDPPVRRQRTLESLKRVVTSIADERPLCLVVEDLQWIDSESQACLDMLVDSLASIRLALIVDYRPEYQHGWSNKSYYTQIRLNPLDSDDVQRLLSSLLGMDGSLGELRELLVSRCEGNPFFIEENVQALLETEVVAGEPGHYRIDGALGPIEIPTTVQAVLAARIGRLPADAKRVLQAASVIGDEIPLPILQMITDSFGEELHTPLELLQAAEFLYERRRGPLIAYMFKHALTRDVAYEGILDEPRASLHSRVVEAIETLYPDRLAEYVERLAYHGVRGKVWGKSVTYLRQAAAKAFALSANRKSTVFLEEALAAVEHLPDDQTRWEQAFEIRLELRPVLNLLGEVRQALERLREAETLAERLNDDRRRGRVFAFVTNVHSLTGELDLALAFGSRALAIAEMLGDLELRILTTTYLEHAHYLRGEYERVIELATANLAALPPDRVYDCFGNAAPASIYDRCWL
ncbi:MAG: AAA family ATPase, partial [Thermoanaerobaculia bacterium]